MNTAEKELFSGMREALVQITGLHYEDNAEPFYLEDISYCGTCEEAWPCETFRIAERATQP